jgi:putative membrane protein
MSFKGLCRWVSSLTILSLATLGTLAGCGEDTQPEPTVRLNDPQITAVARNANQAEIDQGNYALTRATEGPVRDFAQRMVDEHQMVQQRTNQLVSAAEENELSRQLQTEANGVFERIRNPGSNNFDLVYMCGQLALHERVLQVIDSRLIPDVQMEELRTLLTDMRAAVLAHRDQAGQILDQLVADQDGGTGRTNACRQAGFAFDYNY